MGYFRTRPSPNARAKAAAGFKDAELVSTRFELQAAVKPLQGDVFRDDRLLPQNGDVAGTGRPGREISSTSDRAATKRAEALGRVEFVTVSKLKGRCSRTAHLCRQGLRLRQQGGSPAHTLARGDSSPRRGLARFSDHELQGEEIRRSPGRRSPSRPACKPLPRSRDFIVEDHAAGTPGRTSLLHPRHPPPAKAGGGGPAAELESKYGERLERPLTQELPTTGRPRRSGAACAPLPGPRSRKAGRATTERTPVLHTQ